jgi:ATP-binding protein involved in chromosome partitioning
MTLTEDKIRQALSNVIDPDLKKNLVELDAIKKILFLKDKNKNDYVEIHIELVQPILWVAEEINNRCAEELSKLDADIESDIIFSEKPMPPRNSELLSGVKNIIAVASGKGGVGKSAIASNIAGALSLRGAKVGILDGDVYGPSQPTMFGLNEEPFQVYETEDGKTHAFPNEKYGIKVASMGFMLSRNEAAILRGPMLAGYFSMLFEQLEWGSLDFLVFDLPPGTGDIQLTLTQKIPLTGAVIVTTPQEIAVADVRRSIAMFRRVNVDILGIIENMSYFVPPDMPDKKYYIFGKGGGKSVAEENNINFLGEVPLDINMREANDGGKPIILRDDAGHQGEVIKHIVSNLITEIRKHNYGLISSPSLKIEI